MIENAIKKLMEATERNTAAIEKLIVVVEANTNITTRLNHKIVEPVKKEMEEAKAAEKEQVEKEQVEKEAVEKEQVEKEQVEKEAVEKEAVKKEAVKKEVVEIVEQPVQELMEEVEKAVTVNVTDKTVREIANKAMSEGACTREDIVKEIQTHGAKKLDDLNQDGLNGLYAYLIGLEKKDT